MTNVDNDDWVPVSGIDKRSTKNHGFTHVVHITPPVRFSNKLPVNQEAEASNKVEVFAQPPPTILGSFSEFGHATIEAREPAQSQSFRPSYNFDQRFEEISERHYQQKSDYREPEEQKPSSVLVFNAQQRHPQNYHKSSPASPPQQYYQNFQYHDVKNNNNQKILHNNVIFKEPSTIQEPPKKLTPYFVPNDHIFPKPQGNNKQVYAEQRPKPYQLNPIIEPTQHQQQHQHQHQQQQQQQNQLQPQYQQNQPQPQHQHYQQHQQQKQNQQQPFKSSVEEGSSEYFQKYPGHVESQNLYPQISSFARPFEQTIADHNVFIKPNQNVHNLKVGTEFRIGQEHAGHPSRPIPLDIPSKLVSLDLPTTGFAHPATRPFSKYQTPTPKNEELYRIFPVREVNALPAFLPTPVTLVQHSLNVRPKTPYFQDVSTGGSSEYDTREPEQDENESGEQYDIMRSPTRPMTTTTTTTTTTTPRATRKRKPTTTTSTAAPDEYDEYSVPNGQQLQLQEQQQEYQPQHQYHQRQPEYETAEITTTEAASYNAVREERPPVPLPVNKYKKKKPLLVSRPKEPQPLAEEQDAPERMTLRPSPTTAATTTPTTPTTEVAATTTTTTTVASLQQSSAESAASDARPKTRIKYGNSTRPRFSIKDYKTTTSTTSTEKTPFSVNRRTTTAKAATADSETVEEQTTATVRKQYKPRPRPNRYKSSTTTTTTTTTITTAANEEPQQPQETTTPAYRNKYKPGKYYNRLRTTTESAAADVVVEDDGNEPVAATEPVKQAVYSAKRRTVPTTRMTAAVTAEEYNALRRSSSASPLGEDSATSEPLDAAASADDVDYIATTVAVTPSALRHKFHTSYAADRPLLPIESFFQSSMAAGKRHYSQRR